MGEIRGRLVVVLLNGDAHAEVYTEGFTTLSERPMFARAGPEHFQMPWAAVTKLNDPRSATQIAAAHEAGLLIASNVCSPDLTDEECIERRAAGLESGVTMLKDDFPAEVESRSY